jgi:hypothetical protein
MTRYITQERTKYWPVSRTLLTKYKNCIPRYIDSNGDLEWVENGQWHRLDDKPAVIWANGSLGWFQNGLQHRDGDKPALITRNGDHLEWSQNGQWHRTSGPAVIYANGKLEWWVRGKNITKDVNAWLAGEEWQGTPLQIFEFKLRFG